MRTLLKYVAVLLLMLTATTIQAQKHKLSVVSTIGNNCDVDFMEDSGSLLIITDARVYREGAATCYDMEAGDSIIFSVYLGDGWKYDYMEYEGKKIHQLGDPNYRHGYNPITRGAAIKFIMPDHDATIYVYATLDPDVPDLPGTPNSNSWNAATGELFISGFLPDKYGYGRNSLNIYNSVKQLGVKEEDVKKMTIMGEIGHPANLSFSSSYPFSNLETLDLRHTYGYLGQAYDGNEYQENILSYISYSLEGLPNLKTLILPSNIEQIGYFYWDYNPLLEKVVLYAPTPPVVFYQEIRDNMKEKIPEACVLYVPEQSLAAYTADSVWSKCFADVLPIPKGEAEDITVDLPDNFKDGRYVGMFLSLFNVKSGEETKYIIDERGSYIFRSMTCEESYNAQIQTERGVLLASTDTVKLENKPMEMTFKNVKQLYDLKLQVQIPAEQKEGSATDVTDQTTIVWTDGMGNRIATGNTLAKQMEGSRVYYGISLPAELSAHYGVPPRTELVVKEATAQTTIMLAQPDSIILSGKVTDTAGKPVAMATVTASLMMNGTVGKTFTTTADLLGRYELTALTGDLTLSVSARGYAAQRVTMTVSGEQKAIDPIQLTSLVGPTIVYDFTYTETPAAGGTATPMPGYSDYANVTITAYNETTGKAIEHLMVAYPEVQLLEGAKAGDRIRLTASSLKDAFMPVDVTATLDAEGDGKVTIPLVQLGGIEASFERTDNQKVTASLYDAEGQLLGAYSFEEATMTLNELKDGQYTLVMMGSDPLFSKMNSLSDYAAVGLTEGTDYVQKKVTVKSGMIVEAAVETVPLLNADPFYYTDITKTLFMPNKTEVSASCNVTLRTEIGFKDDIKERVSNVHLLVDYPVINAEFVEGSSMIGNKMVRATAKNGRISIPVEKELIDEPVRFILTSTAKGVIQSTAYVQFDIDGREVTQPLGFASCAVKDMTIEAPRTIRELQFPVRGNAPALCPVRLYANQDILVGETKSLADGSWMMYVNLPNTPNLASIPLYAVVTTKQGREVKTQTIDVTYDQNMIRPLHVYMYPSLVGAHGFATFISDVENERIDFDFDHPESIDNQWYVVNPTGKGAPFHFEIVFNTTDSTKVHNVVLELQTVRGNIEYILADYDGNTGYWMCDINMVNDGVCNVDVDYLEETEPLLDADLQFTNTHGMEYNKQLMTAFVEEVERIVAELNEETNEEKRNALFDKLAELIGVDFTSQNADEVPSMTAEELDASMKKTLEDYAFDMDAFLKGFDLYNMDLGGDFSFSHTNGIDPKKLLEEGYTAFKMTDGSMVYELVENGHYVLVDLKNDMCMEVKGKTAESLVSMRRVASGDDYMTVFNRKLGEIITYYNELNVAFEGIRKLAFEACLFFQPIIESMGKDIQYFQDVNMKLGAPPLSPELQKRFVDMCTRKGILENVHDAMSQMATKGLDVDMFGKKWAQLAPKTAMGTVTNFGLKIFNGIGKVFSYVAILNDLKEGYDRANELDEIRRSIPNPCKEDQANADRLRNDIVDFTNFQLTYYIALALADLAATDLMKIGVDAMIPSMGTSMNSVFAGVYATLIKMGANLINDKTYEYKTAYYTGEIPLLQCDEDYKKKQEKWWRARFRAENGDPKCNRQMFRNVQAILDPSGYVYEAVADNRVENATATIYFKQTGEDEYGDLHDEVVKWDAEAFRQQNPQLTDAEGKYAWDVPQGLWQVKIEKAGYETAYSDWLPVPPPQLDINIPLVRKTLPEVQTARAYEDGVEVTFNEYMRPESLTTDRILLSQNGQPLTCRIAHQDRSKAYGSNDTYTSRIKVKTESPLTNGSKVQLTVRRQVEAYNGLQMQNDYQQEFNVVSEVYAIGTDSIVEVTRDGERTITVHAFPAQAAVGMKMTARSVIGTIATITDEAIFDANGEAHLTVKGKTGGQTALLLTLENSKLKAQSVIQVTDPLMLPVYAPTASHISGTYVKESEQVTLHTDTEGATIWYTTDGTCPCDENGTRKKYTSPISVTGPVSIRAYAVKGDDVSRVVTFNYKLYDPVGIKDANASEDRTPVAYYTPDGQRLQRPRKGVNIVRYSDGTTQKIEM